jgi:MFS transporter, DHA1 family, inner membrane transport protein
MPYAILAIALGAFAVGTTEFVVIGLLPTIATDLSVNTATAGLLVTGYAVGIAVGGPILTFATRRLAKPMVLVLLMIGFAVAHLLLAVAPTFELLFLEGDYLRLRRMVRSSPSVRLLPLKLPSPAMKDERSV